MEKYLKALTTDQLKEIARKCSTDARPAAVATYGYVLHELEQRLTDAEFAEFALELDPDND